MGPAHPCCKGWAPRMRQGSQGHSLRMPAPPDGRLRVAHRRPGRAGSSPDPSSVTLDFLKPAIGEDMTAVDRVLRASLASDVLLIRQVAEYIIAGGGKRLRPAVLLLAASACGYRGGAHHTLAAVLEMIHTATL